jgi:tRNA(Leu) C34 or U34 (ribose-2'-O)-methylase TrmL
MNLGAIIRTTYVFGACGQLYFYDPRNIFASSHEEINRFSSGLLDKQPYTIITDSTGFLKNYTGRKIAADISPKAHALSAFTFQDDDLIIFGNERTGIPEDIVTSCDASVVIPMLGLPDKKKDYRPGEPIKGVGEYPSYSVCMSYGIMVYQALVDTGAYDGFSFGAWNNT